MPGLLHIARVNRLLRDRDFDVVHDHTTEGPLTAPGCLIMPIRWPDRSAW
jgi:hypothetical protein